ncbi:MAG: hypothetical protein NTX75_03815 [Proteobacteria bacterium]|nr:hypothetical protein [Pseudomonadota bacterium]
MLQLVKKIIREKAIDSLKSRGYFVARPHFYNPIPDKEYINGQGYWKQPYPCHGIEFNDTAQLSLLEEISSFANEINELPEDVLNPQKNQSFLDMDLEFLYGMIRLIKPKKFIEIGAGWSTLVSLHAIEKNKKEDMDVRIR